MLQGNGQLQAAFLESMVAQAVTDKDVQMWRTVLQNATASLKKTSFTDTGTMQSRLLALDVLLRPTLLKNLLVRGKTVAPGQTQTYCTLCMNGCLSLSI